MAGIKVGDRVRVLFEGEVVTVDEGDQDLPFAVKADGLPYVFSLWVRERDVTLLSEEEEPAALGAPPERSPTAIEERLRALEEVAKADGSLRDRIVALESQAQLQQTALGKLERQVASLLSGANAARQV